MKNSHYLFIVLVSFSLFIIPIYAQESNVVRLIPTDDTFVVVNYTDPDNIKGMSKDPLGNLDVMTTWYVWNFLEDNKNFASVYLKFNLNDISPYEIESATLLLHASRVNTDTFSSIAIFSVDDTAWSENDLTYDNLVTFSDKISNTNRITQTGLYEWDITQYTIDNADSEIAIAVLFDDIKDPGSERVSFVSKDSQSSNFYPTLLIKTLSEKDIEKNIAISKLEKQITELKQPETIKVKNLISSDSNIVRIFPTDDSNILNNHLDPNDSLGLSELNMGNHTSIIVWYSRNATELQELITATGFLKFDVSQLNFENIQSATLNMYQHDSITTNAERIITLFSISDDEWNESEITYSNQPVGETVEIDLIPVINTNQWYSWNVTDTVKNSDEQLTIAVSFKNLMMGHEEQAIFFSKENSENIPFLEVSYLESVESEIILSEDDIKESDEGGGCLIATAAYGSELAPQVQQLRELRDNHLLQTNSGTAFMEFFNSLYYSFSPTIADLERQSPIFKEIVRLSITPLVSSLSILNYVDMDSEESVLGYGISLILFNLGVYFVAPAMLFWNIKNYLKKN